MRILVLVAVILVLVLVIMLVWAYRHRALANDHASAQWMVDIKPTGGFSYGKSDLQVSVILVTPRGKIKQRMDTAFIDGDYENYQQHIFDARIDAENQAAQLNGLNK